MTVTITEGVANDTARFASMEYDVLIDEVTEFMRDVFAVVRVDIDVEDDDYGRFFTAKVVYSD